MTATVLKSTKNGWMERFYWQEYHDSIFVGSKFNIYVDKVTRVGVLLKPSISVV